MRGREREFLYSHTCAHTHTHIHTHREREGEGNLSSHMHVHARERRTGKTKTNGADSLRPVEVVICRRTYNKNKLIDLFRKLSHFIFFKKNNKQKKLLFNEASSRPKETPELHLEDDLVFQVVDAHLLPELGIGIRERVAREAVRGCSSLRVLLIHMRVHTCIYACTCTCTYTHAYSPGLSLWLVETDVSQSGMRTHRSVEQ